MLDVVMNFSDCDQKNNTSKTSAMTMPFLRNPARVRASRDSGSIPTVLVTAGARLGGGVCGWVHSGWDRLRLERPKFLAGISRL